MIEIIMSVNIGSVNNKIEKDKWHPTVVSVGEKSCHEFKFFKRTG